MIHKQVRNVMVTLIDLLMFKKGL